MTRISNKYSKPVQYGAASTIKKDGNPHNVDEKENMPQWNSKGKNFKKINNVDF